MRSGHLACLTTGGLIYISTLQVIQFALNEKDTFARFLPIIFNAFYRSLPIRQWLISVFYLILNLRNPICIINGNPESALYTLTLTWEPVCGSVSIHCGADWQPSNTPVAMGTMTAQSMKSKSHHLDRSVQFPKLSTY